MVVNEGQIVREVDLAEMTVRLRADGIVHVYYKENTVILPELQNRAVVLFRELTGDKKSGYIFESAEGVVFPKESREHSATLEDENSPVAASAVIVKSLASRLVANFFIRVNRSHIKYRVFGNVEDAVRWLHSLGL